MYSIVSVRILTYFQNRWTYGASKGAVNTLTKMMALDLSKDKIRVNSLSPSWTWTPEVSKIDPEGNFSQLRKLLSFY